MTNLTDWLTQARDRADAATEGPWAVRRATPRSDVNVTTEAVDPALAEPRFVATTGDPHYDGTVSDAEFIAAARTDLPAALDAIQAVLDLHAFDPAVPGVHADGCRHCRLPYPCLTVTALATVLGVSEP